VRVTGEEDQHMTALVVPIAAIVTGGPIAYLLTAHRKRIASAERRRARRNGAARRNAERWGRSMRRK
jgi:hypothetical protein